MKVWVCVEVGHHKRVTETIAEERLCLETYGDSYREYMNKTPRWIGIPKSEKNSTTG